MKEAVIRLSDVFVKCSTYQQLASTAKQCNKAVTPEAVAGVELDHWAKRYQPFVKHTERSTQ